ncbi:hypothetical protein IAT38_005873 [Cryptococcus sp. DSM 104549]
MSTPRIAPATPVAVRVTTAGLQDQDQSQTPARTHVRRGSASIAPKSPGARRMSMVSTSQSAALSPKSFLESVLEKGQVTLTVLLSSLMLTGIMYSLFHSTSLDTSQIHLNHLPQRSPYFARKSNLLNVIFVKRAWGWTSAMYLLHLLTSPRSSSSSGAAHARWRKLAVWVLATGAWALFARWFFGAGLGDRIIALTGGNCAVPLPSSIPTALARHTFPKLFTSGDNRLYLELPGEFCTGKPLNPSTLPELFMLLSGTGGGANLGEKPTTNHESLQALSRPRWHKGFDISGHSFLLALSVMVLGRELESSWRAWARRRAGGQGAVGASGQNGVVHEVVAAAGTALVAIFSWMILMTAVYFHNPPEKLAGLALGLGTAWAINILVPSSPPASPFNPRTTPTRPVAIANENSARRGSIVDDGVIYEGEQLEFTSDEDGVRIKVNSEQGSPVKRSGVKKTERAKAE